MMSSPVHLLSRTSSLVRFWRYIVNYWGKNICITDGYWQDFHPKANCQCGESSTPWINDEWCFLLPACPKEQNQWLPSWPVRWVYIKCLPDDSTHCHWGGLTTPRIAHAGSQQLCIGNAHSQRLPTSLKLRVQSKKNFRRLSSFAMRWFVDSPLSSMRGVIDSMHQRCTESVTPPIGDSKESIFNYKYLREVESKIMF